MNASLYGLLALALILVVLLVIVALRVTVKLRAAAARGRGVRVYDVGCDVDLRARLSARSYQIALYLTMKSRNVEPVERAVSDPVSSR